MNTKKTSKRKKKPATTKVEKTTAAEDKAGAGTEEAARAEVPAAEENKAKTPEPAVEAPLAAAEPVRKRSGRLVAWLALFLSLTALTGTAYLVLDKWRAGVSEAQTEAALATLRNTLDATRESLASLAQRLESLAAKDVATVSELQSLERKLNERVQTFESLPGRVGNLEGSVASLQGISAGARDTWLLEEAEYYLQIANAQLQLAGNPHLASLALGFADERLLQLSDPALTEVRRKLADELRAIEVMEKPDVEGITLTLASLAGVVESLPLRQDARATDGDSDAPDPELGGLARAWASLKRTVGGMVSVRRTDEVSAPLTAPDAVYFLRANLALQFQAARLALLRNEQEIFEQSLDDAAAWLNRYYDTDSAPVAGALETIAEIRSGSFSVSPPDISQSLRLLRQHTAVSGSSPRATTEPD